VLLPPALTELAILSWRSFSAPRFFFSISFIGS
jgi:hypothetical protein